LKNTALHKPQRKLFIARIKIHGPGNDAPGCKSSQRNSCPKFLCPSSPSPKTMNVITTRRRCTADNRKANFKIFIRKEGRFIFYLFRGEFCLRGCPRIGIFSQIEALYKFYHRHMIDIPRIEF
jgi:hypothetical protein